MRRVLVFGLGAGLSAVSFLIQPRPAAFLALDAMMVAVLLYLTVRWLRR